MSILIIFLMQTNLNPQDQNVDVASLAKDLSIRKIKTNITKRSNNVIIFIFFGIPSIKNKLITTMHISKGFITRNTQYSFHQIIKWLIEFLLWSGLMLAASRDIYTSYFWILTNLRLFGFISILKNTFWVERNRVKTFCCLIRVPLIENDYSCIPRIF